VEVHEGVLRPLEWHTSIGLALRSLAERVRAMNHVEEVLVLHAQSSQVATELSLELADVSSQLHVDHLSNVIAAHSGAGTIGVALRCRSAEPAVNLA